MCSVGQVKQALNIHREPPCLQPCLGREHITAGLLETLSQRSGGYQVAILVIPKEQDSLHGISEVVGALL